MNITTFWAFHFLAGRFPSCLERFAASGAWPSYLRACSSRLCRLNGFWVRRGSLLWLDVLGKWRRISLADEGVISAERLASPGKIVRIDIRDDDAPSLFKNGLHNCEADP